MKKLFPDGFRKSKYALARRCAGAFFFCFGGIFFIACNEIKSPEPPSFIGKPAAPAKQEFRWSNGKMPKSFDPAKATAAPETDIVRAIFEGLTELDSKTLKPVPAVAEKWSASEDFKTWTFQIRRDAEWSNGEPVTAKDFVRSWKRLTELGEKVSRRDLLKNIVGMNTEDVLPIFADDSISNGEGENENKNTALPPVGNVNSETANISQNTASANAQSRNVNAPVNTAAQIKIAPLKSGKDSSKFGVEAVGDYTLKVSLIKPDKYFPALVVHPVFCPVYGDGKDFETLDPHIVTNGAFRVTEAEKTIVIEPSANYRNRNQIKIERVRFVPTENAEAALAAYRAGEIDAVTNADLQPLALKLLTPFEKEFRQTKHGALNFYEFNLSNKPFDDVRIRRALTIAIERERLTEGETEGSTEPALNFLPFDDENKITEDTAKAKQLLAEAGFADGANFPVIRLMINRNDLQKRIARAVAKMWKTGLNVETEVIVKDQGDFENALKNGEFDIARRGVLFPTSDETANMLTIFDSPKSEITAVKQERSAAARNENRTNEESAEDALPTASHQIANLAETQTSEADKTLLTEADAIEQMPAVPLYFPTSYALVKPYVQGFEMNELDAPSLKTVTINTDWQVSEIEQPETK